MHSEESKKIIGKLQTREGIADILGMSRSQLLFIAHGLQEGRYTVTEIKKRNGGVRRICSPHITLKRVQRKLADILSVIYPAPVCANGFISGRSIITNAAKHLKKNVVLKVDLEDYFPSINFGRIYSLFRAKPFLLEKPAAATLAAIITYEEKLPQGAPTSPVVANMITYRLDKELMALTRSSRKLWYTRYADDITLSTKETTFNQDIVRLAEDGSIVAGDVLTSIIESNGFTINSKKTRLHSGFAPKYITGVKVNEKLNLDRRYIRGIRAILYKIKTKGLDEVNKEFVKKYSKGSTNISNTVFGMIQHVGYIRGQIDPVYRKLWNSYCDAEGKGRHYLAVDMLDQILEKVFVINAGTEQGSGFFVEKMLITCGHVVSPHVAGKGYIDSLNEIQYHNFQNISSTQFSRSTNPVVCKNELDIVGYYSHFNLQHLLAESSFDIGDATSLGLGDTVFCLGYADYKLGNKPEYYEAKIVSIIPNKDGVKEYNIDKTLFAGMSGGPVLNSKYQVVGVVARGAQSRHERQHESTSVFLSLSEYFQ